MSVYLSDEQELKIIHICGAEQCTQVFFRVEICFGLGKGTKSEERNKCAYKEDTTCSKVSTFLYCSVDGQRILAVSKECKSLGLEKRLFGEPVFFCKISARLPRLP